MACNKPKALRKMVLENRAISPPLISSRKGSANERDILYNRIDQQVELISVLKQRLDEMTKRWERSEGELEQQEGERSKIQMTCNKLTDKCSNLELRWKQLSENHRDMILLKDDYKEKVVQLTNKLKQYERGESAALASLQNKNKELRNTLRNKSDNENVIIGREHALQAQVATLEERLTRAHGEEQEQREQREHNHTQHLLALADLNLQIDSCNKTIQDTKHENSVLQSQVSDLTQQIISRGKLVHEKEDLIKELKSDRTKRTEEMQKVTNELTALKDSVNNNRVVRDLRRDLIEERDRYKKLESELARFKIEAKARLKREQNVNEELRHVSSAKIKITS